MKVGFQFSHLDENSTYIAREDWPKVEELIDRLSVKNRAGYKMVNSVKRPNCMLNSPRGPKSKMQNDWLEQVEEYMALRINATALILKRRRGLLPDEECR